MKFLQFIKGLLGYWWAVIRRSFNDATKFCGADIFRTVIATIFTLLAAIAYGYITTREKAEDKILWFALTTTAAWFVELILFFFIFIIRTPYLLLVELESSYRGNESDLRNKLEMLAQSNQGLISEVNQVQRSNPTTNRIRRELEGLIGQFERVISACKQSQKDSLDQFHKACRQADSFIKGEVSSTCSYVVAFPYKSTYTNPIYPQQKDFLEWAKESEMRIEKLREVLSDFS